MGILEPVALASELDSAAIIGIAAAELLFEYDGSAGFYPAMRAARLSPTDAPRGTG